MHVHPPFQKKKKSKKIFSFYINYILKISGDHLLLQGRIQELEMRGAKLFGEGPGGRLRPPVGPGQSHGRGPMGQSPPEALGF